MIGFGVLAGAAIAIRSRNRSPGWFPRTSQRQVTLNRSLLPTASTLNFPFFVLDAGGNRVGQKIDLSGRRSVTAGALPR